MALAWPPSVRLRCAAMVWPEAWCGPVSWGQPEETQSFRLGEGACLDLSLVEGGGCPLGPVVHSLQDCLLPEAPPVTEPHRSARPSAPGL